MSGAIFVRRSVKLCVAATGNHRSAAPRSDVTMLRRWAARLSSGSASVGVSVLTKTRLTARDRRVEDHSGFAGHNLGRNSRRRAVSALGGRLAARRERPKNGSHQHALSSNLLGRARIDSHVGRGMVAQSEMKSWCVLISNPRLGQAIETVRADLWTINHGALLFWRTEGKTDHLVVGFAPGKWIRVEPDEQEARREMEIADDRRDG